MNIVRISRTFPPIVDGTAMHMYELSKYQNEKHDLTLIIPRRGFTDSDLNNIRTVNVNHDLIFSNKLEKIKFHLKAFLNHYKDIREADILHCVGDVHDIFIAIFLKPFFKYKLILSIHAGTSNYFLYRIIIRVFFPLLDAIYVVSSSIKNELDFLPSGVIFVQSSGINYREILKKVTSQDLDSNIVNLVSVGRLNIMKAYQDLINAMKYLPDNYKLTIIGDGPEFSSLETLIYDLSLNNRVKLAGNMDRAEIQKILCDYDIFALSSIKLNGQEEGTPTAMMEAMAAGLPIVSTNTGGVKELLSSYPRECIVPQKNPNKIALALYHVGQNLNLRKELSEKSLTLSKNKDWLIVSSNITSLFKKILST
jgi:glycosyltransferase involved in cell wall biosynthesis